LRRVLVLGDVRHRGAVAQAIESVGGWEVVDCDPALGDCVMYVRLEGKRFDAFVFVGWRDPVTRGALAVAPESSILVPHFDDEPGPIDAALDGYLFRLPRALGLRTDAERAALLKAIPKAAPVPSEIVGPAAADPIAWRRLLEHVAQGEWQWSGLHEQVERETRQAH
jgi:hypothetical protein